MKPLEFDGPPTAWFIFDGQKYDYVVYAVATHFDDYGELLKYLMNFYKLVGEAGKIIIWRRRPIWDKSDDGWKLTWRCALLPHHPDLADFVAPIKPEGDPVEYV